MTTDCSNCGTTNPEGARFCMNCGQALTLTCTQCGTELPPAANFCFHCGHPVAVAGTQTAAAGETGPGRTSLHQYIPREFLDKLNAARERGSMVGERRVVTMLFCDVKGSTAAAGQLDPEEWAEIMNGAFEHLIAPVSRYEGTVARLMGDAILAFFGAPIAHEDDPVRAVLAGLDIVRGIQSYRQRVNRDWGLDFNVRVGIHTGLVVVGEVGSDMRLEYTAMGDAINLAARMESTAVPGTVQITADTHKLVAPLFDVWEVSGVQVKGKAEPVTAYRVLGHRAEPGRLRGIEGLASPLVGRGPEMALLRRALADVRTGRGQIVSLIGEAGLGKSRLIQELRDEWMAARPAPSPQEWAHWGEMGATSYGAARPYGMIKYQIRQLCNIHPSDPPEVVRDKLAHTFERYPPQVRGRMQRVYRLLLGAHTEGGAPPLEGEAFKRELFAVMLDFIRAQVGDEPTVYVFDDVHWADSASVELLAHLLQLVESLPVLFLFALRPYREAPGWEIKVAAEASYPHCYSELPLRPLSAEEGGALVDGLLAIPDMPAALRELILSKAEGNPFFLEEVLRTLIERGVVVEDKTNGATRWQVATAVATAPAAAQLAIPGNLQALLMARIDRLEEDVRHVLQLASVIGRAFYFRVLEAISEHDGPSGGKAADRLGRRLNALQRIDLIYELSRTPELEYRFRQTLARDAAYNSILRKRRREFHRRVGEAMERLFADQLDEQAAVLAHHFSEAQDDSRALRYYTLAGDAAARLYANTEAVAHYEKGLEIARGTGAENDTFITLYTRRGRTLEVCGHYDDAIANYRELERLGLERDEPALRLAALIPQATLRSTFTVQFDPQQGRALSEQALALARELGDHRAEAKIYWNLMLLETYANENMPQAVTYGERSLAIARQHHLQEEIAFALHDLTRPLASVGQGERALAGLEEAGEFWRKLGNLPMLADNLATTAGSYAYIGQYDRAIEWADEALRVSQEIGSLWGQAYSLIAMAPIHLDRGDMAKAIAAWEDALPLAEQANFAGPRIFTHAYLAQAYGLLGDFKRGRALVEIAMAEVDELGLDQLRPFPLVVLAWLHLYQGDLAQANAILEAVPQDSDIVKAEPLFHALMSSILGEIGLANEAYAEVLALVAETLAAMRSRAARPYVADLLLLQGRALRGLGRTEEARAVLAEARLEAQTVGSRRSLWAILAELGRLEAEHGDPAAAQALRQEAREVIAYIADHAGMDDPSTDSGNASRAQRRTARDLRASFLARADVQAVMGP